MPIIGRKKELQILNEYLANKTPEFLAIYGRRRIGKTYLISEFFKDKGFYFELIGRKDAPKSEQLRNFITIYSDAFNQSKTVAAPNDWTQALNMLRYKIESLDSSKKVIIFFDELPWLASRKSGFLEALDLFWNKYMSRRNNTILIICGSAAEWMLKKVISNKAGLHNRLTRPALNLKPFTLEETEQYLQFREVQLERKQIIDIYMAIGGVAYYLNLVPRGKSSAEVITQLFFVEQAPLFTEFRKLFDSLYDNSERHIEVIKTLAKTCQGLTQTEIFSKVESLSPGGGAVTVLDELESCGFIFRLPDYGKKKKEARYRLIDSFTLFYLKWVKGIENVGEFYWIRKQDSQSYHTWAGYAFENLCFQHYHKIVKALGLTVTAEAKSGWRYLPRTGSQETGAQIDLIIDRSDKCINLCEIKFYEDELTIDKSYAQILRKKKSCFRKQTKTRKTLFTTLITPYGVKKDKHYFDAVDAQVTMDGLFS